MELSGVAAICPPLDMSACADALERRANRVYQLQFVTSLNASYRKRRQLLPEAYEAGRERAVSTVRQFDDRITAFYGGYRDAEDYYEQVSPGPRLQAIEGGGHVGFVGRSKAPGYFWGADRILGFLESVVRMSFRSSRPRGGLLL